MNSNDANSRTTPTFSTENHTRPITWLTTISPLLRYVNTRTLAFLMFLGFAVLNTTHGRNAEANKLAAITTNMETLDNGHRGTSEARTEPTGQTISAALVLWQLTGRIVQAFTGAVSDPSLIEYAQQQGTDTLDLQTTPCRGAERNTSTY
jgi:hypothetical protein